MPSRTQLIQLIHIAKNQLALDDDSYRHILTAQTGCASCKHMTVKQLEDTLTAMKRKGFKTTNRPFKRRLTNKPNQSKLPIINKIRAIWITMGQQGVISDSSDAALDAYVRRMTNRNNGQGVDHIAWCNEKQAYVVLESLKQWQKRVITKQAKQGKEES